MLLGFEQPEELQSHVFPQWKDRLPTFGREACFSVTASHYA